MNAARNQTITGAAVLVGCAAACSVPVLVPTLLAGGAAFGLGGLVTGAAGIALMAVLVSLLAGGLVWWRRHRAGVVRDVPSAPLDGVSCGCGGACS